MRTIRICLFGLVLLSLGCNLRHREERSDVETLLHAYGLPGLQLTCGEKPTECGKLRACLTRADRTIFLKMKGLFDIGLYADQVKKKSIKSDDLELCAQSFSRNRRDISIGLLKEDDPAYWSGQGDPPVLSYIMYSQEQELLCLTYYWSCKNEG